MRLRPGVFPPGAFGSVGGFGPCVEAARACALRVDATHLERLGHATHTHHVRGDA